MISSCDYRFITCVGNMYYMYLAEPYYQKKARPTMCRIYSYFDRPFFFVNGIKNYLTLDEREQLIMSIFHNSEIE